MCSGSEAGWYSRLIDVVSLNSRLESNKEEEGPGVADRPPSDSNRTCDIDVSNTPPVAKRPDLAAVKAISGRF